MKPAPFVRHAPKTVEEAVTLLGKLAESDGRVLAGGQSLVPIMAFRLAKPAHLVDINEINELRGLVSDGSTLTIGACVRHAAFHKPVVPGPLGAILSFISRHIAHYPIRMRGTFCGSIAHADPSSEWCLTAVALDATMTAVSVRGERLIPAKTFFAGIMTTELAQDELLTHVRIPLPAPDTRFGFNEFSRRAGDFAMSAALVSYRLDNGRIAEPRIGVGGAEPSPRRVIEAERVLMGERPGDGAFRRAADMAAQAIDPLEDHQTNSAYRRELVGAVVRRALEMAAA
jgi:carbon-monoxide dehydrogenase medium subunit